MPASARGVRPEISIVVVAYNSADVIGETIEHLHKVTQGLDAEIVVVDNASTDNSFEVASERISNGQVIRSEDNLGFGGGVNLGLQVARGEFALIQNDDVLPRERCIEALMEVLNDPSVGLAGPRMIDPDDSDSFSVRLFLPGPRDELARLWDAFRAEDSRTRYPNGDQVVDVGLLICACVLGRTAQLRELGGFNSSFFMYGEDIDLCRRMKANGLRVVTVPWVTAVHDRTVAPSRRYLSRPFTQRILDARDTYYRIWLARPTRTILNLWRAIGPTDQPFRLRYHLKKAVWDGPSLSEQRTLDPLPDLSEGSMRRTAEA